MCEERAAYYIIDEKGGVQKQDSAEGMFRIVKGGNFYYYNFNGDKSVFARYNEEKEPGFTYTVMGFEFEPEYDF